VTGIRKEPGSIVETRVADVPWYVTDTSLVARETGWSPRRDLDRILTDLHDWLIKYRSDLETVFDA
jgi:UDP-glucose 4-epimerase